MLWNTDCLKAYGAQLIGQGLAWKSYDYVLPFSKYVVTNCRNEVWHVRKPDAEHAYISGQGSNDLHTLLASIETPLQLAAEAKHKAALLKAYQSWITRLEDLAKHITSDGQTGAYIRFGEAPHDFKPASLVVDHHEDVYMDFNEEAKLICGYCCSKSFSGVPSFHKHTKRYWGFPNA